MKEFKIDKFKTNRKKPWKAKTKENKYWKGNTIDQNEINLENESNESKKYKYYGSRIKRLLFSMGPIVNRNHFIPLL